MIGGFVRNIGECKGVVIWRKHAEASEESLLHVMSIGALLQRPLMQLLAASSGQCVGSSINLEAKFLNSQTLPPRSTNKRTPKSLALDLEPQVCVGGNGHERL